jgi:pyridoxal phosphate enzyme (YggS family)
VAGRDPGEVELLAVSKTHPAERVREAHAAGQRLFGENRVQELVAKDEALRDLADLQWDLIGSLQTNKVKDLVPLADRLRLLHCLDRAKLADSLQRVFEDRAPGGLPVRVLLQVHATGEESKHGVPPMEVVDFARYVETDCPRLRIEGLMAMGPLDDDPVPAFELTAALRTELEQELGRPLPVLSLGMSGDLEQAIAAGSTLVRIGTAVFGDREPRPDAGG